ncbi:hypothetical protein CFOL_v3_33512, partial [Cephalotus follicularis]
NMSTNENNTQQQAEDVVPLNSKLYIDAGQVSGSTSMPMEPEAVERVSKPSMIFFPSSSPQQEWETLSASTQFGISLTGSAATGSIGPILRLMALGETDDSYYFRVNLPGVSSNENDFSCEILSNGKIIISEITTTGEKTLCRHGQVFTMITQNLPPPGRFSMSFQLPGPVDPPRFRGQFLNGVLEGIIKKRVTENSTH